MNIFRQIGSSIYGKAYYEEVAAKSFGSSFVYYLKLALLVSLAATIVFSFRIVPTVNVALVQFGNKIVETYPADLEITIAKGKVSINQPEPYTIPMPAEAMGDSQDENIKNIIVIDTKHPFDLETFAQYKAVAWLMKDGLAVYKNSEGNQVQFVSLAQVPDTVITRDSVSELSARFMPFLRIVPFFVVPGIFIAGLFYFAYRMLYLLIFALLVWALLAIMGRKINYGIAYKIGLHAMTLPIIIAAVGLMIGFPVTLFPLSFTVIMLVMVGINHAGDSRPTVVGTTAPPPTQSQ
ncbi:MAG: hypothetical protein A3D92_23730 [Bacteroidetes bacterium RIFCSPHIGHO2_02_FULL_44_7]|uniref:DUF1189 domain-containing protein n=1 Tax=Candidatus Yanofskybacteria bacterium RIFCSPLOWO2_01_FULL_49_25 TaxID=1802701 RepID=A0A1F8GUI6_9BACT|nr:MAG: hypothetical protein A3D92_23730 [Bacteroidetes bacterium RIFCSPHIGHO2_02_FULL_44_7]OGN29075.1 MAG: hypothetical protein A3A33_00265 [Candidatus Yanofskybacteria bacterium RIFCSPLOWO2_01_FULL_49_25]